MPTSYQQDVFGVKSYSKIGPKEGGGYGTKLDFKEICYNIHLPDIDLETSFKVTALFLPTSTHYVRYKPNS